MSYTAAVTQGKNTVQTNHLVFVFLMHVFEKGKESVESEKKEEEKTSLVHVNVQIVTAWPFLSFLFLIKRQI
jgi:hypothetical protein